MPKSDREEFKAFFDRMGVVYEDETGCSSKHGDSYLSAGQGIFWFRDGRYTGVEWDEMGSFDARKEGA